MNGFGRTSNTYSNENNLAEIGSNITYQIVSKDKRHQLHPTDVKQFVVDDNMRRALMIQKKQFSSIGSDLGGCSFNTYN